MGANVIITKYKESDSALFYYVCGIDFEEQKFYIEVIPQKKIIIFYKNNNFNNILGKMDLNDLNKPFDSIAEIHYSIVARVGIQILKAIKQNYFPNDLSFISH